VVASSHLYGGTTTQLTFTLPKMGIRTTFVAPGDFDAWEKTIGPKTKALYGETIGNPQGSILDIGRLAALGKSRGIPLVVDNTVASPALCRPMEHGATLVVHSATKYLGGHGNSLGGILLDSGKFDFSRYPSLAEPTPQYHNLRYLDTFGHYAFLMKARSVTLRDTGASLSPLNAFLLLQVVETLSLRMERHVQNALGVARFLKDHPRVAWVSYAGLPDHPDHALSLKYLPKGPSAVLSFGLKPRGGEDVRLTEEQKALYQDRDSIERILNKFRVIAIVGLSADPQKASSFVAGYLLHAGYTVVPINPKADVILGQKVYRSLKDVQFAIDVVDIFRPAAECDALVEEAIAAKARAFWQQLRIANIHAAERARGAGLLSVVDLCVKMEHGRYNGGLHEAGMNTELISARRVHREY
jgi:predicted CoA-binding protein